MSTRCFPFIFENNDNILRGDEVEEGKIPCQGNFEGEFKGETVDK